MCAPIEDAAGTRPLVASEKKPNLKSILSGTLGITEVAKHYGLSRREMFRHLVMLKWLEKGAKLHFVLDAEMVKYRVLTNARGVKATRYYLTQKAQEDFKKYMVFLDLYPREI